MATVSKNPNLTRTIFAAQVRRYRDIQGMTMAKLSERSGLSYTYLSAVENGHSNISIDNIHKIAEVLKVPAAALFIPDYSFISK